MKRWRGMGWEVGLLVALIAELLIFSLLNSGFANPTNLLLSTSDFIAVGLVALGLTLVIGLCCLNWRHGRLRAGAV